MLPRISSLEWTEGGLEADKFVQVSYKMNIQKKNAKIYQSVIFFVMIAKASKFTYRQMAPLKLYK